MNLSQQIETAKQLSAAWLALIEGHLPTQRQFLIWLSMYDLSLVEKGIQRCAIWANRVSQQRSLTDDDLVRYASGVMANAKRDAASKVVPRG